MDILSRFRIEADEGGRILIESNQAGTLARHRYLCLEKIPAQFYKAVFEIELCDRIQINAIVLLLFLHFKITGEKAHQVADGKNADDLVLFSNTQMPYIVFLHEEVRLFHR